MPCRRGLLLLQPPIVEDVVVAGDPPRHTAVDDLVEADRAWLARDRGLAATMVLRYETTARRFLQQRTRAGDGVGVAYLTGVEVEPEDIH
jgi:hypothetical protein